MFSAATSVTPTGDGRYSAVVADGWDIAGNSNGGYLAAIVARAMAAEAGRADPVTVTTHYLAPGRPGPVTVETRVIREGRRFATVSGTMLSGDAPVVTVLGTFGDLGGGDAADAAPAPELVLAVAPDLPPPEDCFAVVPGDLFPPPFMGHVELRLHPDDATFLEGVKSGTPRLRGWFRLPAGEPVTTLVLVCAVDAFPPTIFNADLPIAWTPTVELTSHIRAVPAPGWLACEFSTRFVAGGFLEVDGEIWDGHGRLVAQSRQLALVPRG